MSMCTPSDLSPSADDVGENIRRGPWIGVMKYEINLIVSSIVDTEALLQEMLIDIGLEVLGAFRAVRVHVISQLVGKIFSRMRGIGKDARVP